PDEGRQHAEPETAYRHSGAIAAPFQKNSWVSQRQHDRDANGAGRSPADAAASPENRPGTQLTALAHNQPGCTEQTIGSDCTDGSEQREPALPRFPLGK